MKAILKKNRPLNTALLLAVNFLLTANVVLAGSVEDVSINTAPIIKVISTVVAYCPYAGVICALYGVVKIITGFFSNQSSGFQDNVGWLIGGAALFGAKAIANALLGSIG